MTSGLLFIFSIILIPLTSSEVGANVKKCHEECVPNHTFVECDASCQPYCGSSFTKSDVNCGCVHGCVCKDNMIRNLTSGRCITIENCNNFLLSQGNTSEKCNKNEHFAVHSGCQLSCYTFFNRENSEMCQTDYINSSGCVCNENYVRDTMTGECIEISKCKRCRPNEEWIPCSNCTTLECKISCGSCKCLEGYIQHNNHCIRNCANKVCDSDREEYLECSNCENCCFNNPRTTCDKNGCYKGCFCKKEFVRNPLNGTCVSFENCPPRCRKHEVYSCQWSECEATCQDFNKPCNTLNTECKFGCYCRQSDGYVRHNNGSCIHYTECL